MATGPRLPSVAEIVDLATGFGIEMSETEAASYQRLMTGALRAYRRIDELTEVLPPVKYPRDPGYRPPPEENPYNAWYWRTNIKGASSGPLAGMRVGVKDAICVAGVPMMNGSRVLEGFVPNIDATVVTRLLDAGATIVGKTNSEDCSFSAGGHTCTYGPVRNPRKPTCSPGGSSNGSAVALAAGDIELALGADQGGSIRIPAAWCGVVGLKPTYGLVPYTGCMSIDLTLDHVGPMANTVEDAARMLSVIAGSDPLDPRQRGVLPPDYVKDYRPAVGKGVKGVKIAVLKEGFGQSQWEDLGFWASEEVVDRKVRAAVKELEKAGAVVGEVSVPPHYDGARVLNALIVGGATELLLKGNGLGSGWMGFYHTQLVETWGRGWRSQPGNLPATVKTVLLLGEHLHRTYYGRYYAKAQNLRPRIRKAYDDVLASYDVIVMPTVPFRASPLPLPDCSIEDTMVFAFHNNNNTPQFNVTGHPAISVPCGMEDGLPIGMMIVGRHFDDVTVLQVADAVEKIGDWKTR